MCRGEKPTDDLLKITSCNSKVCSVWHLRVLAVLYNRMSSLTVSRSLFNCLPLASFFNLTVVVEEKQFPDFCVFVASASSSLVTEFSMVQVVCATHSWKTSTLAAAHCCMTLFTPIGFFTWVRRTPDRWEKWRNRCESAYELDQYHAYGPAELCLPIKYVPWRLRNIARMEELENTWALSETGFYAVLWILNLAQDFPVIYKLIFPILVWYLKRITWRFFMKGIVDDELMRDV